MTVLRRTRARARWSHYREFLRLALANGYVVRSVEDWFAGDPEEASPVLILRHDVDQAPRSVPPMLAIERELGIRSSWYFRWRTADPDVIDEVRSAGGRVGLHYETLTRLALHDPSWSRPDDDQLSRAREILHDEIRAFGALFGGLDGVCPHGDTRVPGTDNRSLMRRQRPAGYGARLDAREVMRKRPPAYWLSDRPAGWAPGARPGELLAARTSPLLCVVHPNNWMSGTAAWRDRILAAGLPTPPPGSRTRIGRSRGDTPPSAASSPPPAGLPSLQ